jgi:hypothetical protein
MAQKLHQTLEWRSSQVNDYVRCKTLTLATRSQGPTFEVEMSDPSQRRRPQATTGSNLGSGPTEGYNSW